jgi:ABC-type Zn uptake system ZnuABC Zn-binding protein ZnuA
MGNIRMNKKHIIGVFAFAAIAIAGGFLLGRYYFTQIASEDSQRLKIAATLFPVYDIASHISTDSEELVQILPIGASPHTYDPTVKDQIALDGVSVLFTIGLGLDDFALKMAQSVNKDIEIVELYSYVNLAEGEEHHHGEDGAHQEDGTGDHEEEHFDPHYFTSIQGARSIAKVVYETLVEYGQGDKEVYRQNYENYIEQLNTLEAESLDKLSSLARNEIITFHDAFSYMAGELGLEVVATIEPFSGKEPSIEYIANVQSEVSYHGIKALFSEPQLSSTVVGALARDVGVPIYILDPIGGTAGRTTFVENYRANVDALVNALQ